MNDILPRKRSAKLRAHYIGLLVQFLPNGLAMLMRPNKAETVVHGCHCLGDMAVRMRKVLARPWVPVILVPRGRAPFGQHQESRPLARSNDIPVLNGFVNTID